MLRLFSTLSVALIFNSVSGQVGGRTIFNSLQIPSSARMSSVAGSGFAIVDNDAALVTDNASLMTAEMDGSCTFNFFNYFDAIDKGSFSFVKHFKDIGTFNAAFQYVDYGGARQTDITGTTTGSISANDIVMNLAYAKTLSKHITGGVNFKFINSNIAGYQSSGIAGDISATYFNPDRELGISLIVQNIGAQLSTYSGQGDREPLPYEVKLGFAKKIKHAPFRLLVTLENLQQWDLTKLNPNAPVQTNPLNGEKIVQTEATFFDKMMRHVVFGTEIVLSKNFLIRGGFDYRQRREMQLAARPRMVGFNFGLSFRINRFHLTYGRSFYHLAGGVNQFTIVTKLVYFKKGGFNPKKMKISKKPTDSSGES